MKKEIIIFIVTMLSMIAIPLVYKAYQCTSRNTECTKQEREISEKIRSSISNMIRAML